MLSEKLAHLSGIDRCDGALVGGLCIYAWVTFTEKRAFTKDCAGIEHCDDELFAVAGFAMQSNLTLPQEETCGEQASCAVKNTCPAGTS